MSRMSAFFRRLSSSQAPYRYSHLDQAEAQTEETKSLTQPLVPDKSSDKVKRYFSLQNDSVDQTAQQASQPSSPPPPQLKDRSLGTRLKLRKKLMKRQRWLVDTEFMMAMMGILLMVIENELYYANNKEKGTAGSLVLKLAISVTTVVLLVSICLYYQAGAALRMLDSGVDDFLAVTPICTWLGMLLELLVCAVHPFPGNIQVEISQVQGGSMMGSLDGILSVLMMMRLYLVGKFLVMHSHLLTDPSTQSMAAVSHVKVNVYFVVKAALNEYPAEVMTAMILSMYIVSVWCMRTCELYYSKFSDNASIVDSMWLSAITFLTVGYGDRTPSTQCGRFVAIPTALMGMCSTALLVAVLAKKLEQTRQERHLHSFLTKLHLRSQLRAAAADVVKLTIKLRTSLSPLQRNLTQYKLNFAIRNMRASRAAHWKVEEASVGLSEVCQLINRLDKQQQQWQDRQRVVLDKLDSVQQQLNVLLRACQAQESKSDIRGDRTHSQQSV